MGTLLGYGGTLTSPELKRSQASQGRGLGCRKKRPARPALSRPDNFKSPRRRVGRVPASFCTVFSLPLALRSLHPSGPRPHHAQPRGRWGAAPTVGLLSRAPVPLGPAPLRRPGHVPYAPTPQVLLFRRGHSDQARAPRARRLLFVRLRLHCLEPLDGSLPVSGPGSALGVPGDVAARLPERGGALSSVPPAPSAGAASASPLRPAVPGPHRYEVRRRPRPGKFSGQGD